MGLFHRISRLVPFVSSGSERSDRACMHGSLTPRWESPDDDGDNAKATEFICDSCGTHFSPERADWMRRRTAESLRR